MTKEKREKKNAYLKAYYRAHKEQRKEYGKAYYSAHKEQHKERMKSWKEAHKDECKARVKADVNSFGVMKHTIRKKSRRILKQKHLNIPGYQIHHCFGYDDPSKFIYISRSLHLKIHQYLRDNNIDAASDHWLAIKDMVSSVYEYVYVNC